MQSGNAFYAIDTNGSARTITVSNSVIADYQKNGVTISGAGLTANITANTVTGQGDTTSIAQNGVEITNGAVGYISGNTVSGNEYGGPGSGSDWITQTQATGIVLIGAGAGTTVSGNWVDGNDIGIAVVGGQGAVSQNILGFTTANRYYGILADSSPAVINQNTVTGGNVGVALYSATSGYAVVTANQIHTGAGIGVEAYQATVEVGANDLTGNKTGIQVESGALVDAGGGALGSLGNNILTGYTDGGSGYYAIVDLNTVAGGQPDVMAQNNSFGPYVHPSVIANYVYDNHDDPTLTHVDTSNAQGQVTAFDTVYVDSSWASIALGTIIEWDGNPADDVTMGENAFATIQDGVNAVATSGTVDVLAGTYAENVVVNKSVSIIGPNAGYDPNAGLTPSNAQAIVQPAAGSSADTTSIFYVTANNVTIQGLTIEGSNAALNLRRLRAVFGHGRLCRRRRQQRRERRQFQRAPPTSPAWSSKTTLSATSSGTACTATPRATPHLPAPTSSARITLPICRTTPCIPAMASCSAITSTPVLPTT